MRYWFACTAALFLLAASACELESEDCDDAKRHFCEKLPGQNCDASTMDNARDKVNEACGNINNFFSESEAYCQGDPLDFDVDACVER